MEVLSYFSPPLCKGEAILGCDLLSSFVGDLGPSLVSFDGGDLAVVAILEIPVFEGLAGVARDSVVGRLAVVAVEGATFERRSLVAVGRVADGLELVEDPRVDIRLETPFPIPPFFSSPEVIEASVCASDVVGRGARPTLLAVVDDVGRVGGLFNVLPVVGRVDEAGDGFEAEDGFVLVAVELLCEAELPAAGLREPAGLESGLESTLRRATGVLVESAINTHK
ncbi:MAG: hypothetical protein Q9165_006503 [Trypethelium subeluteriae]